MVGSQTQQTGEQAAGRVAILGDRNHLNGVLLLTRYGAQPAANASLERVTVRLCFDVHHQGTLSLPTSYVDGGVHASACSH